MQSEGGNVNEMLKPVCRFFGDKGNFLENSTQEQKDNLLFFCEPEARNTEQAAALPCGADANSGASRALLFFSR